jgi:Arc/MetJ-type ribon-helix-helix transcriptional regulator
MATVLKPETERLVAEALAGGYSKDASQLIDQAVREFLDRRRQRDERRRAMDELARSVDEAGLYERVLIPDQE